MTRRALLWGTLFLWLFVLPLPSLGQAFSIPISDRVVEGDLAMPDGSTAHFTVREGSMLTVRSEDDGYWYGFIPQVAQGETIRLTPFEIAYITGRAPHIVQISGPLSSAGEPALDIATKDGVFQISPTSIFTGSFPRQKLVDPRSKSPHELQKIFGASGGGLCCVTCGGITVCGGSVIMSCGSCESSTGGRPAQ